MNKVLFLNSSYNLSSKGNTEIISTGNKANLSAIPNSDAIQTIIDSKDGMIQINLKYFMIDEMKWICSCRLGTGPLSPAQ
jgi:hypothetical protein